MPDTPLDGLKTAFLEVRLQSRSERLKAVISLQEVIDVTAHHGQPSVVGIDLDCVSLLPAWSAVGTRRSTESIFDYMALRLGVYRPRSTNLCGPFLGPPGLGTPGKPIR